MWGCESLSNMGPSAQGSSTSSLAILGCLLSSATESPSGVAASSHPLGRGGWAQSQSSVLLLGELLASLGVEVSLSDSTEAWGTPTQARVFLPGLLAQLTGKAKGNSLVWKLCGRKLWSEILLEVHFSWLSSSV